MLDFMFPAFAALLRLRAAPSTSSLHSVATQLPDAIRGAFAFLMFMQPCRCGVGVRSCCQYHRGSPAREFVTRVGGHTAIDLKELAAACRGSGCLVRTAFGGVGHLGLSEVDRTNQVLQRLSNHRVVIS